MELMEGMGIDVSPLREKSRKLVFESADGKYRYIMVKPSDVPTYVDHGVADVGMGDAGDGVAGADPAYAERAWVCPGFEKGVLEPGTELLSCSLAIEGR